MRAMAGLLLAEVWGAASPTLEEHGASVMEIIFPLINFLIFLYLVKRFLVPVIKGHIHGRREEILAAVKEADDGKKRAEESVKEYQSRLSRLAQEMGGIRDMLRQEGEAEKGRLLQEAQELSARMKQDADFLTDQEIKIARHQLRCEIARLAQETAANAIQRRMTEAERNRLVEEFVVELGEVR